MRIDFRQGIIKYPILHNQQSFLLKQSSYVTLSADNGPTDYTTIHGNENYLFTENLTVQNAWGPLDSNTDYWLYFDINLLTGVRTFGSTKLAPIIGNGLTTGYQQVIFENVTLSSPTNLPNTLFDLTLIIDRLEQLFVIDGSVSQTFETFLIELNTKLGSHANAIFNVTTQSLKITSKTNSSNSNIVITSNTHYILSNMTGFNYIEQPITGTDLPVNIQYDQHWFNTRTNTMNVYDGSKWNEVIRVFATKINNSTFTPLGSLYNIVTYDGHIITSPSNTPFAGSQIGINNTNTLVGRLIFDGNGKPIKRPNGSFFTTEHEFFVNGSPVNDIKLESNVIQAIALETIPKYHVIKYTDFNWIKLASYNDIQNTIISMATQDILKDDVGSHCVEGIFYDSNWNWTLVGAPLWINDTGELTTDNLFFTDLANHPVNKPPVAWVLSPTSVLFNPSLSSEASIPTNNDVDLATELTYGISRLSIPADNPLDPIVVGDNDPRLIPYTHPPTHDSTIINTTPYNFLSGTKLNIQLQELADKTWSLNELTDVQLNNLSTDQILKFDGTQWVNSDLQIATGATILDELNDVTLLAPQNNQFLQYNGSQWINVNVNIPQNLNQLNDVILTNLTTNQILKYNGSNWINSILYIPVILDELNDVNITAPSINQVLQYNGSQWINTSLIDQIGATILDELNDVIITNPSVNQVLQYNGTQWINNSLIDLVGATILDELNDVNFSATPVSGNILTYNGITNQWDTNINVDLTNKIVKGPILTNYAEQTNIVNTSVGGILTIDLINGNNIVINLTENITNIVINNSSNWQVNTLYAISFIVIQNSITPYTITWPSTFKWDSSSPVAITNIVDKIDVFNLISYDSGSTWLCFTASQNMG